MRGERDRHTVRRLAPEVTEDDVAIGHDPTGDARRLRADVWVESTHVERYVVAARLKPGEATAAERTLLAGPPFDPAEAGLSAHAAYLTNDSVYLVFEGEAAHANALQLVRAFGGRERLAEHRQRPAFQGRRCPR
jgi:hypothetical protein